MTNGESRPTSARLPRVSTPTPTAMDTHFRQRLTVVALALAAAAPARAQLGIELGLITGPYSPLGYYREPFFGVGTPETPSQNGGFAVGAAGRVWLTDRLGLQLQASTSSASLAVGATPAGGAAQSPLSIHVTSVTAEAVLDLAPEAWHVPLRLGLGGGVIHHAGIPWDRFGAPTNAVAAVSLGSSIQIDRRLAVDVGVSSLWYGFHVNADFDHRFYVRGFQADVTPHVGLMFAVR